MPVTRETPGFKYLLDLADSANMVNSAFVNNSIDWPVIKRMVQSGTQIDVQFSETEQPIPYVVIMALDSSVLICRAVSKVNPSVIEESLSPMIYIPTARDLCTLRVAIEEWADGGKYLALSPLENAAILKHRRLIRIKSPDNISYRVQFEGRSSIYKGIAVQDISKGGVGLLVYAASPIKDGVQARIEISLPQSNDQASAVGTVSHCIPCKNLPRMYRIGIQFTKISPRDKQIIALFINQHLDDTRRVKKT